MGLREKLRPTYSNIHLVFHSSISCFHKISIKKNTTPNTSNPQIPAHTKYWSLSILRTGCPKSDEGGSQFPYSLLQPPHQLLFISRTTFLFQRGNAEVSQKGFLRRLAWISASVPVDSRWIGLCQWSAQRSSQNRPQPDCPTLAQACPCTFPAQDKIQNHKGNLAKKKRRWSFLLLRGKTSPKNSIWYVNHSSHSAVYCVAIFHSLKFLQQPYGTDSVYY